VRFWIVLLLAAPLEAQTGFTPGFVDTLEAIAGRPKRLEIGSLPLHWLGSYDKSGDVIRINPALVQYGPRHRPDSIASSVSRNTPDWVLPHEYGHRFDKRRGFLPSKMWLRESFGIRGLCDYANTDRDERWAEAFANAVDFLRYAAVEPSLAAVLRSRAQREAYIPGTSDVVDYLLKFRVFREHPLNRRSWR